MVICNNCTWWVVSVSKHWVAFVHIAFAGWSVQQHSHSDSSWFCSSFLKQANVIMCNLSCNLFTVYQSKPEQNGNSQLSVTSLTCPCQFLWPSHCAHPFNVSFVLLLTRRYFTSPMFQQNKTLANTASTVPQSNEIYSHHMPSNLH